MSNYSHTNVRRKRTEKRSSRKPRDRARVVKGESRKANPAHGPARIVECRRIRRAMRDARRAKRQEATT